MTPDAQAWTHTTVLLAEAVEALVHAPDGCYVDGTFGRAVMRAPCWRGCRPRAG